MQRVNLIEGARVDFPLLLTVLLKPTKHVYRRGFGIVSCVGADISEWVVSRNLLAGISFN